jgi:hypothetical protein
LPKSSQEISPFSIAPINQVFNSWSVIPF